MHTLTLLIGFSGLALGGTLQIVFLILRSLRGHHSPDGERTFYNGVITSFAFGQILYGLLGLLLIVQAPDVASHPAFLTLTSVALLGWLSINLFFIDPRKPRLTTIVFGLLVIVSTLLNL